MTATGPQNSENGESSFLIRMMQYQEDGGNLHWFFSPSVFPLFDPGYEPICGITQKVGKIKPIFLAREPKSTREIVKMKELRKVTPIVACELLGS